ncbi:variable large family protein (plasmid) [Borreliella finlandensis]|uniref:variable large family protein n=1 Tax=Borreliella finlandensis TaxID=498741 RepID=UPI003AF1C141
MFEGSNGNAADADAEAIGKAAAAVSAISGEQILKAIVGAAGAAEKAKEGQGKAPSEATNPIAAAIGTNNNNGADFDNDMKKSDKIAAAIVLRGLAKGGKFAADDANGKENVKSAVESAVGEVSGWLEEMIKAAGEAAAGSTGGGEKIGDAGDDDGQKGKG